MHKHLENAGKYYRQRHLRTGMSARAAFSSEPSCNSWSGLAKVSYNFVLLPFRGVTERSEGYEQDETRNDVSTKFCGDAERARPTNVNPGNAGCRS